MRTRGVRRRRLPAHCCRCRRPDRGVRPP